MSRPKCVIFGATGFIGRRVNEHLRQLQEFEVEGHDSKSANLLSLESLTSALQDIDAETSLVWCSTLAQRGQANAQSADLEREAMHNVREAIAGRRIAQLVFLSSVDVYGLPANEDVISEATEPKPMDDYARAKLRTENFLLSECGFTFPVCVLRLPGIYGQGDGRRSTIGSFFAKVEAGEDIRLAKGGRILRDFVEIGDVCRAIEDVLAKKPKGVFNLCTGKSESLKDMVDWIQAELGQSTMVECPEEGDERCHDLNFDNAKILSLYSREEFVSMREGIALYRRSEV